MPLLGDPRNIVTTSGSDTESQSDSFHSGLDACGKFSDEDEESVDAATPVPVKSKGWTSIPIEEEYSAADSAVPPPIPAAYYGADESLLPPPVVSSPEKTGTNFDELD